MESDSEFENRIRPQELDNFRGQEKVAENLRVFIRAALMRGDSLDHVSVSYTHLTLPTTPYV